MDTEQEMPHIEYTPELPVVIAMEIPIVEGYIVAVIKKRRTRIYQPSTGFYFW